MKQSLFRATGRANLAKQKLEETLLDIEIVQNNRPLIYIEDGIQMPVFTANALSYGQPRIQRYINRYKEAAWKRWKKEYLLSLREKDNMMHNTKKVKIKVGDMVLIKGEKEQRKVEHWNSGKIVQGQRRCHTWYQATNTKVTYRKTNSVLVSTQTSLRFEKNDKNKRTQVTRN